MPWLRTLAREPLVHFLALGALLFAVDARCNPAEPAPDVAPAPPAAVAPAAETAAPTGPIVVDEAVRAGRRVEAERRLGRPPTPAELEAEVARWIDEEVLYREAMARGLDRDDPVIHERIASRMTYVLEQALALPEPTDAELRAYFTTHASRWGVPDRVDFTHVFVAGTDAAAGARLAALEQQVAAGQPPDRLGDVFSGGRRYRGRKLADLAQAFGESFVDGLGAQAVGTWQRRTSRLGLHLVRVDRIESARAADFAAARLDVRKAFLEERRAAALGEAIRGLRVRHSIVTK